MMVPVTTMLTKLPAEFCVAQGDKCAIQKIASVGDKKKGSKERKRKKQYAKLLKGGSMLIAICDLKNSIRVPDKKAAEYCFIKDCKWLKLAFKRGGKGANGQSGRPVVVRLTGGSTEDVDFFCGDEGQAVGQQRRNFRGNKKSLHVSRGH